MTMNNRRWLILWLTLAAILIVFGLGRSSAQDWQTVDDDGWCKGIGHKCEVRETTLPAWGDLSIHSVNGSIEVEAWDRDEIQVRAKITVKGSDRDETMDRIEIETDGHDIRATGPRRHGGFLGLFGGRSWSVSYRVMVPRATDIAARTVNGSVRVTGVDGDVDFGTVNGGVKLFEIGGSVEGGTTNGSVTVSLAAHDWHGEGVDLHTTNGGVRIELPSDFSARLDLKTTNGGISVEHPVTIERNNSRHHLRGTIGDGGSVVVRARTTNGGVHIDRLDA